MADEKDPGDSNGPPDPGKQPASPPADPPPSPEKQPPADGPDSSGGQAPASTAPATSSSTAAQPPSTSGPPEKKEPARFKKISRLMHSRMRTAAAELKSDVELLYFGQPTIGDPVLDTLQICQLLHEASPRILVKVYDSESDKQTCIDLNVLFYPTLIIRGKNRGLMRFLGTPSGYQLPVLVEALKAASEGTAALKPRTRERLATLKMDLNIKSFVTPVCPYCPRVSRLVLALAVESPRIKAEIINAQDFSFVSKKYRVEGTPRTVINEKYDIDGALHEGDFMEKLLGVMAGQSDIYY